MYAESRPAADPCAPRLAARGHDADVDLERRLAAAEAEMNEAALFDHVVVNREGSEGGAVDELLAVLASERAKPGRAAPKV